MKQKKMDNKTRDTKKKKKKKNNIINFSEMGPVFCFFFVFCFF